MKYEIIAASVNVITPAAYPNAIECDENLLVTSSWIIDNSCTCFPSFLASITRG